MAYLRKTPALAMIGLLAACVSLALAACGGGEPGLSDAEVEEVVLAEPGAGVTSADVEEAIRAALAEMPQPAAGLTSADVEEAIRAALAEMPQPAAGLTSADVEEAIRAALAEMPQPAAGLTSADVEEAIRAALAEMPQPAAGLTSADVERIAQGVVASIPPRSLPAEYTKFFVRNAISRYDTLGLDATVAHYNRPESIDGQWYVFVIDDDDLVISHPDPERRGLDLKGWVGTDLNGYNFGPDMLSATEDGRWVSYVYRNPESGGLGSDDTSTVQLKNAWVQRHDGLLFASGWYVIADEFTKDFVAAGVEQFRQGGLEAVVEYFTSPDSDFAGLESTIEYYNSADNIEGDWFAFIADTDGEIINHYNPEMVGGRLADIFGADEVEATQEGNWVTTQDLRVWVVDHNGMTFGSGWSA